MKEHQQIIDKIDKVSAKVDDVKDSLHSVSTRVTLIEAHDQVQNKSLDEHIKRTNLLEEEVGEFKYMKKHIYYAILLLGTVVTVIHKLEIF